MYVIIYYIFKILPSLQGVCMPPPILSIQQLCMVSYAEGCDWPKDILYLHVIVW